MTPLLSGRLSHLQRRVVDHRSGLTRSTLRGNLKQRIHPFVRARGPIPCLILFLLLRSLLLLGREGLGGVLLRVSSVLDVSELTFITVSATPLGKEAARLLFTGSRSPLAFTSFTSSFALVLVLACLYPHHPRRQSHRYSTGFALQECGVSADESRL